MLGYKYVDNENELLTNIYSSFSYSIGKSYHEDGIIKYHKTGFHFSTYPENTLRFTKEKRPSDYTILEVDAFGTIDCGDDDQSNLYYGYDGMYTSSDIRVIRVVPRREIFDMIVNSINPDRIVRYIKSVDLNQDEIEYIIKKYANNYVVMGTLYYYQFGDKNGYNNAYDKSFTRLLQNKSSQ